MKNKANSKKDFMQGLFLTVTASVLFWLSNPNIFFENGLGFIAFLNYLPVLFLIKKSSFRSSCFFGLIYGALSYALYGYWLQNFHPLGLIIVIICYAIICAVFFTVLKWASLVCKKNGWLLQFICICAYEFIKTRGYFGLSYGVTAYTQWQNIYLIQICQLAGVFALNLLVIFPSVFLYSLITKKKEQKRLLNNAESSGKGHISAYVKKEQALSIASARLTYITGIIWFILITASFAYGIIDIKKTQNYLSKAEFVTVAAIQNNESPWKNGIEEYSKNVMKLIQLTEEAQLLSPDIDFVVWPETAVAPSIIYNYDYGTDIRRFLLISQLLNFIDENDAVFVIGNSHEINVDKAERARYNSALIFESGKNVHPPEPGIYSKNHLVPFTESFPWKYQFPSLYAKLLNGDTHMWERGDEYTVFDYRGLKFSTPICFEDTFSSVCRRMALNGSKCFINLSNDSWSKSMPCQKQHLAMAVFRSVENGIPSVRSTTSGVTCIINPDGKVLKTAAEFCPSYIIGRIPLMNNSEKTAFSKIGDIAGYVEFALALIILIMQTFIVIINKIRNKK